MAEKMSLHGSGLRTREEWSDLVASVLQATAVWADLDGMHRASLPDSMPVGATHLWFWDTGRYGRIRIDGDTWIAGVLTEPGLSAPMQCDAVREDGIVVDRVTLTGWSETDGHIQQLRGDREVLASFTQFVPRRPATGVFLAVAE